MSCLAELDEGAGQEHRAAVVREAQADDGRSMSIFLPTSSSRMVRIWRHECCPHMTCRNRANRRISRLTPTTSPGLTRRFRPKHEGEVLVPRGPRHVHSIAASLWRHDVGVPFPPVRPQHRNRMVRMLRVQLRVGSRGVATELDQQWCVVEDVLAARADGIGVAGADLPNDRGHRPTIGGNIQPHCIVGSGAEDTGSGRPPGPDRRGAHHKTYLGEHGFGMALVTGQFAGS